MTPAEAKRLVLIGTVGAGTLSAVAAFKRGGGPSFRIAVGALVVGTILAAGAEVQPDIAGGFAILMLTTSFFVVGGDAWQGITDITTNTGSGVAQAAVAAGESGLKQ